MKKGMDFDIAIVGAGAGGCIAARDLARGGLRVALFDASARDALGIPVVVEVESAALAAAGIAAPSGDEVPYHATRFRVFSPRGKPAYTLEGGAPVYAVRLDRFVARLAQEAESAGARFFDEHAAIAPLLDGRRVVGVALRRGASTQEVHARVVVDATGFAAALVRQLTPDAGIALPDDPRDVVIAANAVHAVDADRARAAVGAGLHGDEETWTRIGFAGPYSTEFSHLSLRKRRAYLLVGRKEDAAAPTLDELQERFRARMGYFGGRLYGGGGRIRIRRALDRLVADGFVTVGEAACQVTPLVASGVSGAIHAGGLAATTIAEALASGRSDTEALWPYAARYQRGRGAIMASYDVSRRITETFTEGMINDLLESGASHPEDAIGPAIPRAFTFSLASLPGRIKGLMTHPRLIPAVVRMGMRSAAAYRHYQTYPVRYDPAALAAWSARAASIFDGIGRR